MVTKFLKAIAKRVLREDMAALRAELSEAHTEMLHVNRQWNIALGKYSKVRAINLSLSEWAGEMASRSDGGETQSRLLFIRDMLDHGPDGPYANTHGVHPADRWNIKSFNAWR